MKTLFRTIRQKLLGEGKLLRYLTYALGEIVLIIVGILFALKINDWNEDRKAKAEFHIYVDQLKEDVSKVLLMLDDEIVDAEGKISRELFLWRKLKGEPIKDSELSDFEHALNGLARGPELDFNIGYLGRLINGDMDPIVGNREFTLQVLDMTSKLKGHLRYLNDKVRIIQMADEIFIRHRGRGARSMNELKMTYDLETLKTSDEFIYAVENATEALMAINRNQKRTKSGLEAFLKRLEEY